MWAVERFAMRYNKLTWETNGRCLRVWHCACHVGVLQTQPLYIARIKFHSRNINITLFFFYSVRRMCAVTQYQPILSTPSPCPQCVGRMH